MKLSKNKIYTVVQYCRKPMPSCNWSPRYTAVYCGKELIEQRLNDTSITYLKNGKSIKGYKNVCNIVHDLREIGLDWENILSLGEVEVTVKEFKQFERMFKEALKYVDQTK